MGALDATDVPTAQGHDNAGDAEDDARVDAASAPVHGSKPGA